MKSILLFALVCFFCLNANAGYSGIPSYSFQENVETGESATKMAECREIDAKWHDFKFEST